MTNKPIWESKTFWINVLMAVGMVLTATEVVAVLPPEALPWLAAGNAILNIILRVFFTDTAVHLYKTACQP